VRIDDHDPRARRLHRAHLSLAMAAGLRRRVGLATDRNELPVDGGLPRRQHKLLLVRPADWGRWPMRRGIDAVCPRADCPAGLRLHRQLPVGLRRRGRPILLGQKHLRFVARDDLHVRAAVDVRDS
jgi:hypothetical protein